MITLRRSLIATLSSHWVADVLVVLVVGSVYLATAAPTYSWANFGNDGGDLAAAVASHAAPHPPGFPLYLLLAEAVATFPFHDLARGMIILSVVGGTLAAYLLYRTLLLVTGSRLASITGSFSYAFAVLPWSQATIVEVSTWAAALAMAAGYLCVKACIVGAAGGTRMASDRYMPFAWLLVGLAVSVHPIAGVVAVPMALLVVKFRLWPRSVKLWLISLSAAIAVPAALYGTLILRTVAQPTTNGAEVRTLGQLVTYMTAQQYWQVFSIMGLKNYLMSPVYYAMNVARNLAVFSSILAVAGFVFAVRQRWAWIAAASVVSFAVPVLVHIKNPVLGGYYTVTMLPWGVLVGVGAWATARWLERIGRQRWLLLMLAAPVSLLILNWKVNNVRGDFRARDLWREVLAAVEPNSLVVVHDGYIDNAAGDAGYFSLMYGATQAVPRPDINLVTVYQLMRKGDTDPRLFSPAYDFSSFTAAPSVDRRHPLLRLIEDNRQRGHVYFFSSLAKLYGTPLSIGEVRLRDVAGGVLFDLPEQSEATDPGTE